MAYEQAVSARGGGVIAALLETPRRVATEVVRQDLGRTIRKSRRAERHLKGALARTHCLPALLTAFMTKAESAGHNVSRVRNTMGVLEVVPVYPA